MACRRLAAAAIVVVNVVGLVLVGITETVECTEPVQAVQPEPSAHPGGGPQLARAVQFLQSGAQAIKANKVKSGAVAVGVILAMLGLTYLFRRGRKTAAGRKAVLRKQQEQSEDDDLEEE
ncbi:hypothetical protein BESB_067590 [Besnoitia besnoiti]|uniref:Uncharacterized protein n=1 Tax=Besnoitia besnoiti TaxID=94643 RepID=A0A2A9MFI9_BESBE|nr:hypothetical protein BESB_067590 [Besnoitia besnoiti]PFH34726.1 hypothetical protein BESB_067590 [Besnoitia besnoiti]